MRPARAPVTVVRRPGSSFRRPFVYLVVLTAEVRRVSGVRAG